MNFPLPTTCLLHKTQSTPLLDFDETTRPCYLFEKENKKKKRMDTYPVMYSFKYASTICKYRYMHIQYI